MAGGVAGAAGDGIVVLTVLGDRGRGTGDDFFGSRGVGAGGRGRGRGPRWGGAVAPPRSACVGAVGPIRRRAAGRRQQRGLHETDAATTTAAAGRGRLRGVGRGGEGGAQAEPDPRRPPQTRPPRPARHRLHRPGHHTGRFVAPSVPPTASPPPPPLGRRPGRRPRRPFRGVGRHRHRHRRRRLGRRLAPPPRPHPASLAIVHRRHRGAPSRRAPPPAANLTHEWGRSSRPPSRRRSRVDPEAVRTPRAGAPPAGGSELSCFTTGGWHALA